MHYSQCVLNIYLQLNLRLGGTTIVFLKCRESLPSSKVALKNTKYTVYNIFLDYCFVLKVVCSVFEGSG
jgi:hypothetical protein